MSENWEGIACPLPGPGLSSVNLERGDGPGELAISGVGLYVEDRP